MRLLPVLAASCFVSSMSMRIVDPVVPALARDFVVAIEAAALVASAFTLPYAIGQPFLGSLGDAMGKTKIIKITLAILAISLVVSAFATSLDVLVAARIVGGAAAGGVIPLAFAMVGDRFPYAERQMALSKLLSAIIAGQLTGSIGSGLIADAYGWRVSMAAAAVVAFAALALTVELLKPRPLPARPSFSLGGMVSAHAAVLRNRRAWLCFPMVFAEGIIIFGLLPHLAGLLEARGAGSTREAGLVLAGFGVGGLIYTATVAGMIRRIGVFRLMASGAVIAGAGLALLAVGATWQGELAVFIVIGVGFYMIHNSLQTFATELSPDNRGAAVGAHALYFFLGQAAGPILYAAMLRATGPVATMIVAGAAFAVLGVATAAGLRRLDR
jgi:predicted MFS family arabinose efflux permease